VIRDPRRPGVGGVELIAENGGGLNEEALKQLFQK
jgi:hypothetical protein